MLDLGLWLWFPLSGGESEDLGVGLALLLRLVISSC